MKTPSKMSRVIICSVAVLLSVTALIIAICALPSAKTNEEVLNAAIPLVEANFDAVTYFEIAQLPPKGEAEFNYSDYPEGAVPCDSSVFSDYNALSAFISNTYVPAETAKILASSVDGKPRYFNQNGELCKTVAPTNVAYTKDFSSYKISLERASSDSAEIIVTVPLKAGGTEDLVMTMTKINGKWLLDKMVY